jgi:phage-related protein
MIKIFFNIDVENFVRSLERSTVAKVLRVVDLLEEFGYQLGLPHSKKIDVDLFELRIRGQQEVRIFYTFKKEGITMLHGFIKKSQIIPKREIKQAKRKLKELDRI